MDAELTNKSRDALNAATSRAVKDGHADLTPAHLLLALLTGADNENLTDLLAAVDADQAEVRAGAERLLAALPSVTGSTVAPPQASRDLLAVLAEADRQAGVLGDDYLSTEHLLIAIAAKGGPAAEVLERRGATAKKLLDAFETVRGGRRVTTPTRRASTRPWRSSARTSRPRPARASSTRSSAGTTRSAGWCRCCPGAPRTTRC